ncbi:MAG: Trk family potassium uptake protein, partial [Clostridia bacterium]|nr:Trk family potassium uptake protein [Clostridia bacterium]
IDSRFRWHKMQFYTKFVLAISGVLVVLSTCLFLLFERNNPAYADFNFGQKLLCSFFLANTPRTAGFSTAGMSTLSDSGYLLMLILMFIGGCSGSTAGGIKVSTFAVVVAGMWAVLRGRRDIDMGKRRISNALFGQALAIFAAYLAIILGSTLVICAVEPTAGFQAVMFETVSALGTVGLSMGLTPTLRTVSKLIIILLMYMGRAGILTLAFAIGKKRSEAQIRRPIADTLYIG